MSRVQALVQEAEILRRHGNVGEAARRCRQALRLEPANLGLAALMGELLAAQGEMEEAVRFLRRVAAARTQDADAQYNLGVALQRLGRHEEALAPLQSSAALRGEGADVLAAIGLALQETGRVDGAIEKYRRALELAPGEPVLHNNLGNALQALSRYDEAIGHYRAALAADPGYLVAHNNLGNALRALGRHAEAIESYRRAIALDPENADAHYYIGLAQLCLGDYAEGWRGYDYRHRRPEAGTPRKFREPLWLGKEDLRGKSILLHAEQGLGDVLQFARYAPLVAQKGAAVLLEVYAPLAPLMREVPGVSRVLVQGERPPQYDFHCPLASLPLAFGTTLETIPPPVRYARRAAHGEGGLRVGVCWRGSALYVNDRQRSVPMEVFAPLLHVPGIRFVSLQKDLATEEVRLAAGLGDFIHSDADFAGTASTICTLDLVVTIDTAWGPWSACVGTPAWVLVNSAPHWVWLTGREDSPWYPGLRLFRQRAPGEWHEVIERAARALAELRDGRGVG